MITESSVEFFMDNCVTFWGVIIGGMIATTISRYMTAKFFRKPGLRKSLITLATLSAFCIPTYWVGNYVEEHYDLPLPSTQYAKGYTRQAFNQIEPGDTMERVLDILGPPIGKPDDKAWLYSRPSRGGIWSANYWERTIVFSESSVKVEIIYRGYKFGV